MHEAAKTMPDELDDLARSLRQGAGSELRQEAAIEEGLTELQRRRRTTLSEAVRMAMHRGDTVSVKVAGLTLSAPLVAVGSDYLTMDDGERIIDVRLERATIETTPQPTGGHSDRAASVTLRARLAEHEQSQAPVEIITPDGVSTVGTIEVAAADHIVIDSGAPGRTLIATASVVVVISRRRPRRV